MGKSKKIKYIPKNVCAKHQSQHFNIESCNQRKKSRKCASPVCATIIVPWHQRTDAHLTNCRRKHQLYSPRKSPWLAIIHLDIDYLAVTGLSHFLAPLSEIRTPSFVARSRSSANRHGYDLVAKVPLT